MIVTYKSDEPLAVSFCENDTVKSVLQNIAILLGTKKGTIPQYREFGLDMEYIDKPPEVARTIMAAEIREAIEEFEPRAKIVNLEISAELGKMIVRLEVDV